MIDSASAEVPRIERSEKASAYHERTVELLALSKGNLVRVHEVLVAEGCELSYQALTAYCRRHGIGKPPKPRAGRYHFEPGAEMQHDTSPHYVEIAGKLCPVQTASLALCFSRMLFFQFYPRFTRFECKVFLTDAIKYFGGCCKNCMVDNTNVVRLNGTGATMVPAPEMVAFADHFDFKFVAHAVGDANRSARVERPFHYIDKNFLANRQASDWSDLNRQAVEWCDKVNSKYKSHLRAVPRDLFVRERLHMSPLPDWVAEVYQLHHRIVDVEGYVALDTNRYSTPLAVPVGRQVQVHESKDRIDIYEGPRLIASHSRVPEPSGKRQTLPEHRKPKGHRKPRVLEEEKAILDLAGELATYVAQLKRRSRGRAVQPLRRLLTMLREYPREPLLSALGKAERYGLFDLERVEHMILKRVAGDFFLLSSDPQGEPR